MSISSCSIVTALLKKMFSETFESLLEGDKVILRGSIWGWFGVEEWNCSITSNCLSQVVCKSESQLTWDCKFYLSECLTEIAFGSDNWEENS